MVLFTAQSKRPMPVMGGGASFGVGGASCDCPTTKKRRTGSGPMEPLACKPRATPRMPADSTRHTPARQYLHELLLADGKIPHSFARRCKDRVTNCRDRKSTR